MIISKKYAEKLIRDGKAKAEGVINGPDCARHEDTKSTYMAVTRYDIQRTDHYKI